jgi:hypothetical protein
MSLVVMLAVAIALFLLAAVGALVWAYRWRARSETSVTEARARADASPLTRSVLSVGPRRRPGGPGGAERSDHPRAADLEEWPCVLVRGRFTSGYGRVVLPLAVRFEVNPVRAGGEARRAGCDRVARECCPIGQPLTAASLVWRTAGVSRSRSK